MIRLQNATDQGQQRKIFDEDFQVEQMSDPQKYLPQYQQRVQYETSCIEDCQVGCGNLCILCAAPFGCCGCSDCCCCYSLGTSEVGLVQSFGRFNRLLKPGLNMINPCSEQIRKVDMKLKIVNLGRHVTMTKDNVKLTIDASIAYRVTNPVVAYYILGGNINRALSESTTASIRETIGDYTLDKVLSQRIQINDKCLKSVRDRIPVGISVDNIFIEEIIVPPEIQRDLTAAARQKRISEANIINSKADVQTASLMKQSAQLLDTKAAMQIRYLEMVEQLGKRGVTLMMGIGISKKGF